MTDHRFTDAAKIAGPRRTEDGYLVAEAFVARAGIQLYRGAEVGMADREIVRVWRPESEVTDAASVRGYSHAPITMGHPAEFVTADNWGALAKGEVSTEAEWKDGKLRLPLIVKDSTAIAAIEAGTRELSAGYLCRLEVADGTTPEGEAYDAVQRDIRINHLAIVPAGRAGSECRIGDGADEWGIAPITMSDQKEDPMSDALKTVVLGDKAVQVSPADVATIDQWKADMAKKLTDAETAHADAIQAKDKEIAKAEAERDDYKGKVLSDADLDKRVADRAELLGTVKAIAPEVKTAGLSDADIRKAVVVAKLGDAVADRPAAYIDARFDILAEDAAKSVDPLAAALKDGQAAKPDTLDQVYDARNARMQDAWKTPVKKEA